MNNKHEFTFYDFVNIIEKRKYFILAITLLSALLGIGYGLIQPNRYEATVILKPQNIPPLFKTFETTTLINAVPQDIRTIYYEIFPNLEIIKPQEMTAEECAAILKSRGILEKTVQQFQLSSSAELLEIAQSINALKRNITTELNEQSTTFSATVTWNDPQKASDIANFMANEVNNVVTQGQENRRKGLRDYIIRQLKIFTAYKNENIQNNENINGNVVGNPEPAAATKDNPTTSAMHPKEGWNIENSLLRIAEWLQLESPVDLQSVQILDSATPNYARISPNLKINALIGALLGLCSSIFVALIKYRGD